MSTPSHTPLDLRAAFRPAAASTWVVTGHTPDGPVGFTAISIISVSVDPPVISFNISRTSSSLAAIQQSRRAALHLLSDEQEPLATRFAQDRSLRFVRDGAWSLDDVGLPRLHDVVTRLTVAVDQLVEAGDSLIAVSRVETSEITDRAPLVHRGGRYHPRTTQTPATIGA